MLPTKPYTWVPQSGVTTLLEDEDYLAERLVHMKFHSRGHDTLTWAYYLDFYDGPQHCGKVGVACTFKEGMQFGSLQVSRAYVL